jgi:hypothetical protein
VGKDRKDEGREEEDEKRGVIAKYPCKNVYICVSMVDVLSMVNV